jgi:hypothetical protein
MDQIGPVEIIGAILFLGYIAWLVGFFSIIRPRLMQAIGRRLGVRVAESTNLEDSGSFIAVGKKATGTTKLLISTLDMGILLLATIGVCGVAGTSVFFLDERGVLADLHANLTGYRIVLDIPAQLSMSRSEQQLRLNLSVRNIGEHPVTGCVVGTADYSARNGYVSGRTTSFDLAVGAQQAMQLELSARNPTVGTFPLRIEIECQGRTLRITQTTLTIR